MRRNLTLFSLFMMLSSYALAQTCTGPLSGIYTLGTPTSDYPTFGDALLDLQACGVSGAVTFNVAPDTYTGHIGIDPITGTSATNTVTFDGGTAAGTILTHDGLGPNQNATVLLDEADYITFRNFTINTTGTNDSWCVNFYEDADFNTIDNCILNAASGPTDVSPILMGGSYNNDFTEGEADNNTISNNVINGGERSIIMEGDFSPFSLNNQVLNNVMQGMDDYGIYMDNQDGVVISGNTISAPASTFGDGIYCFDIMNFTIAGNDIQAQDWGIYISDGNFDFTPSQRGIVVNNMVQSFNDYGMYFIDFEETDIWHNTVIGEPAIRINDFPGLDIRNNIFVSDDDYAFEADNLTAFDEFDYNIFFRRQPGSLIRYSSIFADLAAFQVANPTYNVNSIESEPGFTSATDLHSEGTVANDVGDLSVGVSIDIDGDTRPAMGAAAVDIGADEFIPASNDAGVIARITPLNPTLGGFKPIELAVRNFGTDTIYNFEVGWSVNGMNKPSVSYNIAHSPLSGNMSSNYLLVNYNWPNNFSNVRVWTQNPNGTTDDRFDNDTLEFLVCPGLSGTYTVGTSTSDFSTLADAEFALTNCGVSGAVVFELQPGTYNGPLILPQVTGMSAANNVVFDGLNPADVTITHDGSGGAGQNVTIGIDGGDHFTIRNMTIEMTNPANSWGVCLINEANENRIENNIINLPVVGGSTNQGIVICADFGNDFAEGNNANGTVIINNTITGGEMGIHIEGSFSQKNRRNFVLNNTIHDSEDYGIYVDQQDTFRVNGNHITGLSSTFADGMRLSDLMNFQIIGNYVVAPDDGIYLFDGNTDQVPTTRARFINNMVISESGDGIYFFDVAEIDVYHNSVLGSPGFYFNDVNLDFRNNLCLGDNDYAVESPNMNVFSTSDHNLYYRYGAGDLLFYAASYTNLSAWQNASTNVVGFDSLSVESDPDIMGTNDLHLLGTAADRAGDNSVLVTEDIDGDSRPSIGGGRVDIGADEFIVYDDDASIIELLRPTEGCGQSVDSVFVVLRNSGYNSFVNAQVFIAVNGGAVANISTTHTDTIFSNAKDTIFVGTVNTFNGGFLDFEAYVQIPNEQNTQNDTLKTVVGITTSGPIISVSDTVCLGDPAFLTVVPSPGLEYRWFSNPAGTNLVGIGDSFQTPALTGDTTFYVGSRSFGGVSVLTTYANNNTSQGMMFDVESISNVTVSAFDLHINPSAGSAVNVDVYYIPNNTYNGNNNNAGLWTLEGSYTITSAGINNPTNLVLTGGGIPVVSGQTTAVFVDLPGSLGDMENTNGTTNYTDGFLTVLSGGETNGTFTGSFFNGRIFNGEVYYTVPACNSAIVPVTASTNTVGPTVGLNGTIQVVCSDDTPILDAGNLGATYAWSTGETTRQITATAPDTYIVTVTVAGCSSIDSSTISYFSTPSVSLNTTDVSCHGGVDGAINLTVSGGGAPYIYNWSNGDSVEDPSGLGVGNYTCSVAYGNGCTTIASISISEPQQLLITSNAVSNISCTGGSNGSIDISVSGGVPPYSYLWSNGSTTEDINGLIAGGYTVTITDAVGCTEIKLFNITEPTPLSILPISVSNVSCAGGSDGAIATVANGGTAPYNYLWTNGAITSSISGLNANSYTVLLSDVNSCITTDVITITEPLAINTSINSQSQVSCFGGNDGILDINVTGGTIPYTYNWSDGSTTEDISGLSAGSYTASITDLSGCTASIIANITEPNGIQITLDSSTDVTCNGGSDGVIDVMISGGTPPYSYNWSQGATTLNISGLIAGAYTLTVNDNSGCASSSTFTITEPAPLLSLLNGSTNISCNGVNDGTVDLSVVGGTVPYAYTWSNGATTQDLSGLSIGSYTGQVVDANGCMVTIPSASITSPTALTATINGNINVSCNGANDGSLGISVNGGAMPYTYNWSNGESAQNISGLSAGNYTCVVVDANACTVSAVTTLLEPSPLTVATNGSVNPSCNGGSNGSLSTSVSGGSPPYNFTWSNSGSTQSLSGLAAGTYNLTVTDNNGCEITSANTITEPSVLTSTPIVLSNSSCNGVSDGSASMTVIGGIPPYTYSWSTGAATQSISGLGGGTYTNTIVDANSCVAVGMVTVTEPSILNAVIMAITDVSACGAADGAVNITVTGGTAPYTFQWSNGLTSEDINGLTAGSYNCSIFDANGCATTLHAIVDGPAIVNIATSSVTAISCNGLDNGAINVNASGGSGSYIYNWSNGMTTEDLTGLSSGIYELTVTDSNNCSDFLSITLQEPPPITLVANISDASCNGRSDAAIDLSVSAGTLPYTYNWSNGAVTQDVSGVDAGTYNVFLTDANDCSVSDTFSITEPPALNLGVDSTGNVSACGGSDGFLATSTTGGTVPYVFDWSNSESTADITGLTAGVYTLTVTDAKGCAASKFAIVAEPSTINVNLVAVDDVSCNGFMDGAIDISVTGGTGVYNYSWSNGSTNQDLVGLTTGTYAVTISDGNGCNSFTAALINQPLTLQMFFDTVNDLSCNGATDAVIDISVSGGSPPYSYTWSNGAVSEDLAALSLGSYTVSITDINNCSLIATETISSPPPLEVILIDNNDGSVTAFGTGGTVASTYNFIWDNGQSTATVTGLNTGISHCVTITDDNACTDTSCVSIVGLGVISLLDNFDLQVFPNPTSGNVYFATEVNRDVLIKVSLFSVNGQQLLSQDFRTQPNPQELQIAHLPAGVYFIRFLINDEKLVRRIIIRKP